MTIRHVNPTRFTWRAGADRVAHATWYAGARRDVTACGVPAVLERLHRPERTRCHACLMAVGLEAA